MASFSDLVLDTVVTVAATTLCFMGVSLKDDARPQVQRAEKVVVRRLPAPAARRTPSVVTAIDPDCPDRTRV